MSQPPTNTPPLRGFYTPTVCVGSINPQLTFDTFVPCRANEFLVEVARVVADEGENRPLYNPLFVYGEVGLGKTHLLSAIANRARNRTAILLNTVDLEAEIEHAERQGKRAALRRWLISVDILLIDDVQLCKGREEVQRELFAVFNHAVRHGTSLVITCDVPPTRLREIEKRLLSRLGSGVILGMQLGDKQERLEILRRYLGPRSLPKDVLDYLAENVTDNVRRLKGAAAQLLATQERLGTPADVTLARAIAPLETDLKPTQPPKAVAGTATAGTATAGTLPPGTRFKEMLAGAETEEEQLLALQIAVGERVRELKAMGGEPTTIEQLETALALLREGHKDKALSVINAS
jgi:chromosomal replication initiator protein